MNKEAFIKSVYENALADEFQKIAGPGWGSMAWNAVKGVASGVSSAGKSFGNIFKRGIGDQARKGFLQEAGGHLTGTMAKHPIASAAAIGATGIGAGAIGASALGGNRNQQQSY